MGEERTCKLFRVITEISDTLWKTVEHFHASRVDSFFYIMINIKKTGESCIFV